MGTKMSVPNPPSVSLVKDTYKHPVTHRPQCMFENCTRKSTDLFTVTPGITISYLPVSVSALQHLGLIMFLKPKVKKTPFSKLRFCKKHANQFFRILIATLLSKYGEKVNNIVINNLMKFASPLDQITTKNILTAMQIN